MINKKIVFALKTKLKLQKILIKIYAVNIISQKIKLYYKVLINTREQNTKLNDKTQYL